jgi:hypothetical protein
MIPNQYESSICRALTALRDNAQSRPLIFPNSTICIVQDWDNFFSIEMKSTSCESTIERSSMSLKVIYLSDSICLRLLSWFGCPIIKKIPEYHPPNVYEYGEI